MYYYFSSENNRFWLVQKRSRGVRYFLVYPEITSKGGVTQAKFNICPGNTIIFVIYPWNSVLCRVRDVYNKTIITHLIGSYCNIFPSGYALGKYVTIWPNQMCCITLTLTLTLLYNYYIHYCTACADFIDADQNCWPSKSIYGALLNAFQFWSGSDTKPATFIYLFSILIPRDLITSRALHHCVARTKAIKKSAHMTSFASTLYLSASSNVSVASVYSADGCHSGV